MDIAKLIGFIEFNSCLDYLIAVYLGAFIIQLFYYLFFFSRLAFHKHIPYRGKYKPISIIICAKNERESLLEFLPLYFNQNYSEFEVIVVNDSSVDDTEDVLKAFALQFNHLKVLPASTLYH